MHNVVLNEGLTMTVMNHRITTEGLIIHSFTIFFDNVEKFVGIYLFLKDVMRDMFST